MSNQLKIVPKVRTLLLGYFDREDQAMPSYDPPLDSLCLVCMKPLAPPIKTISLRYGDHSRSWFYRTHKACYEFDPQVADDLAFSVIEGRLM